MINVRVIGQKLCLDPSLNLFMSGSENFVKFKFQLDEKWDGMEVYAQFKQNENIYDELLDEDNCVFIPAGVDYGTCTLTLRGTKGNVRGTTNYLTLKINNSPMGTHILVD